MIPELTLKKIDPYVFSLNDVLGIGSLCKSIYFNNKPRLIKEKMNKQEIR